MIVIVVLLSDVFLIAPKCNDDNANDHTVALK